VLRNRSANDSKLARKQNYPNSKLKPQLQKNADALLGAPHNVPEKSRNRTYFSNNHYLIKG